MQKRLGIILGAFWLIVALALLIGSFFPDWVSHYYSFGLFQSIGKGLRTVSMVSASAIGEYVYLLIVIILIIKLIQYLYKFKNEFYKPNLLPFLIRTVKKLGMLLVKLYVVFMLLWGLNYQKASPASSFQLKVDTTYTEAQLDQLSLTLMEELNSTRLIVPDSAIVKCTIEQVFAHTVTEFETIQSSYPFLQLEKPSLKQAKFPSWGDYIGYMAFYHPITGEAIIRGDVPILTLPFTSCHELAHQMGYASEAEANFIAFVVASESKDPILKYSMLLQLFTYCQSEQLGLIAKRGSFQDWKKLASRNKQLLNFKVIQDRKYIREFFAKRQHLLIPASASMYNQFLQWNKQAKGINSYNDVLLWAIAYKNRNK